MAHSASTRPLQTSLLFDRVDLIGCFEGDDFRDTIWELCFGDLPDKLDRPPEVTVPNAFDNQLRGGSINLLEVDVSEITIGKSAKKSFTAISDTMNDLRVFIGNHDWEMDRYLATHCTTQMARRTASKFAR